MTEERVSSRYAKALIESATKEGIAEQVLLDFGKVAIIVNSSIDLRRFIKSPIVHNWQKKKIFKELFAEQLNPLTFGFINLLADKHREALILDIIVQYEKFYNLQTNKVKVIITSARELTDALKARLIAKLTDTTKKTVLPQYLIDTQIMGGLQIQIQDWVYDASVRNYLNSLKEKLIEDFTI